MLLASGAVMLLAAVGLFALRGPAPARPPAQRPPAVEVAPAPAAPESADAASAERPEQVVDDSAGTLLWASPTVGAPPSLAYIPGGAQCLLHIRPAMLAAHPEGERILAALGPWGAAVVGRLQSELHAELNEIDALLVAIVVGPDGQLDATLRATFFQPQAESRLPADQRASGGERNFTVADGRAFFLDPLDATTLVVCPEALAAELLASGGEAPALVRDVESLAAHVDADRAVSIVVAAKFLTAGGHALLDGEAAPLHAAVAQLLGADTTAAALSAHWEDSFFVELRATPALNVPPRRLAALLGERIAAGAAAVEEAVLAAPWHPHGRKVVARLPGMLRTLTRYTRTGDDDRQAVVRTYLPAPAGHNLLMATELFLTQPRSEAAAAPTAAPPASEDSLDARLAKVTSLTFSKDSLERALELLAEDLGVEIVIQGADLQLDGITKNQSLGLDMRNRPAGEILVEILRRANPDRTATSPADPRQKLVYVVDPKAAAGRGRIIVTTRAAAAKRNDSLPSPFVPAAP